MRSEEWGCGKLPDLIGLPALRPPFELFVGLRYTRAKRRTHFISFISFISVAGIALGIWALITVMSVMNGFEKEIRARILGAAAHVQVVAGETPLEQWEGLESELKREWKAFRKLERFW